MVNCVSHAGHVKRQGAGTGARTGVGTGARTGVGAGATTGVGSGARTGVGTGARTGFGTGARTGVGAGAGVVLHVFQPPFSFLFHLHSHLQLNGGGTEIKMAVGKYAGHLFLFHTSLSRTTALWLQEGIHGTM